MHRRSAVAVLPSGGQRCTDRARTPRVGGPFTPRIAAEVFSPPSRYRPVLSTIRAALPYHHRTAITFAPGYAWLHHSQVNEVHLERDGVDGPITIRDVADRAGVALSSVSRVLSDHPDVSAKMRKRVEDAANELGYQPDMLAQSLRSGSTRTVGFVIRDISNPLFAVIARRCERSGRRATRWSWSIPMATSRPSRGICRCCAVVGSMDSSRRSSRRSRTALRRPFDGFPARSCCSTGTSRI